MNHNPSDDSANVPPFGKAVVNLQADRLNPVIQQALGCLDLKLEDELNRFRSEEENRSPSERTKQITEVNLETQSGDLEIDSEILTAELVQPVTPAIFVEEDAPSEMLRPDANQEEATRVDRSPSEPTNGFIIIDGLSSSIDNSSNAITTITYAPISLDRDDISSNDENLDLKFSSGGEIAAFHNEYLSSSQELLRQIQSGYPPTIDTSQDRHQSAPPAPKRKLKPIQIGSIAAACVLAGGGIYTYLNPNILAPLTATKAVAPIATTTNSLGQSIQSPNLAANEFTDLNLSTINTIKLPAPTTTNVSMATTSTMTGMPTTANTPVAIPFNGINPQTTPPTTILATQPRLAQSLVKSLLPPNFQSFARQPNYRTIQPRIRR
jgi:hypothetical protein